MQPLISVIIPCHNVAEYLPATLDCLLAQDLESFEVLAVDDHSSDGTLDVLKEYSSRDGRIIAMENQGVGGCSATRNLAIPLAKGEWLTFIDSDDLVPPDYLSTLYGMCKDHGASISCVQNVNFEDGTELCYPDRAGKVHEMTGMDAIKEIFYQRKLDTTAWSKLFRREVFGELRFPDGLIYEDLAMIYKVFRGASRVVVSEDQLYGYRQRTTGIKGTKISQAKLDSAMEIIRTYESDIVEPDLQDSMRCRIISLCYNMLMDMDLSQDCAEVFIDKVRQYRMSVLKDRSARRKNKLALVISFLGVRTSVRLLNAIKSLRRFLHK